MTRRYMVLSLGLLALLLVQVSVRIRENNQRARPGSVLTRVGDGIPPLVAELANRSPGADSTASRSACHLIYFFDPGCAGCRISAPTWAGVDTLRESVTLTWVDVSGDPHAAREFIRTHQLMGLSVSTPHAYPPGLGLARVPTLWVLVDGHVRYIAEGADRTSRAEFRTEWCDT
jgi:hypothetical protein